MKQIAIIISTILISTLSLLGQKEAVNDFFNKYKEHQEFSTVYISPRMFGMFSNLDEEDIEDEDAREVIKSLKGLQILTTEENGLKYYKEAKRTIETGTYEILMSVDTKGDNVEFYIKDLDDDNYISELLLLVGGEESFVLMSFLGKIPLDKVGKLSETIEIDGVEHLGNLERQ